MRRRQLLVLGLVSLAACGAGEPYSEGVSTTSTATAVTPTSAPLSPTTTAPDTTTTTRPATTEASERYQIVDGVFQGPGLFTVALGDEFEIEVVTDSATELHVHGYDLVYGLVPGEPTVVSFAATVPGIFEVEMEGTHTHLFDIEVNG